MGFRPCLSWVLAAETPTTRGSSADSDRTWRTRTAMARVRVTCWCPGAVFHLSQQERDDHLRLGGRVAVQRITTRNARFQQLQTLLGNRNKRGRAKEFLVQGVRPITMAMEHGWTIRSLLYDMRPPALTLG